jgi:hypothetical protein
MKGRIWNIYRQRLLSSQSAIHASVTSPGPRTVPSRSNRIAAHSIKGIVVAKQDVRKNKLFRGEVCLVLRLTNLIYAGAPRLRVPIGDTCPFGIVAIDHPATNQNARHCTHPTRHMTRHFIPKIAPLPPSDLEHGAPFSCTTTRSFPLYPPLFILYLVQGPCA